MGHDIAGNQPSGLNGSRPNFISGCHRPLGFKLIQPVMSGNLINLFWVVVFLSWLLQPLFHVPDGIPEISLMVSFSLGLNHLGLWFRSLFLGKSAEPSEECQQGSWIEALAFRTAAVCMIVIDDCSTIQAFNPAAENLFGYKKKEILGKSIDLLMINPTDAEWVEKQPDFKPGRLHQHLLPEGETILVEGPEIMGRKKNGELFPMEVMISETHLSDGRLLMTGVVYNLTDREKG